MPTLEELPTLEVHLVDARTGVSSGETPTLGTSTDFLTEGYVTQRCPLQGCLAKVPAITCPAFVTDREESGPIG